MNATQLSKPDEKLITERLLTMLATPEHWTADNYTLDYVGPAADEIDPIQNPAAWLKSYYQRISLWTCSGFGFFKIYRPVEVKFRFRNKWKLWRAVKAVQCECKARHAAEQMKRIQKSLDLPTPPSTSDVLDATEISYKAGSWIE